ARAHAASRKAVGAEPLVAGVALVGLRIVGAVPEADDVERHIREAFEVWRVVHTPCEMLREVEVALDHFAISVPAVSAQCRPDRDAARAARRFRPQRAEHWMLAGLRQVGGTDIERSREKLGVAAEREAGGVRHGEPL